MILRLQAFEFCDQAWFPMVRPQSCVRFFYKRSSKAGQKA